jgi:hypothetical protein
MGCKWCKLAPIYIKSSCTQVSTYLAKAPVIDTVVDRVQKDWNDELYGCYCTNCGKVYCNDCL